MLHVFFSYSHKDETLRNELEIHLEALKRQRVIDTWHDRRITAGEEFDNEISEHLESADIILLLVSPDFIASDYCYNVEMGRALERHETGEARVIPIILRPCSWQRLPFGKLLALPTDGKPVIKHPHQDDAFLTVTEAIQKIADQKYPQSVRKRETSKGASSQKDIVVSTDTRSSNLRIKKEFTDRERDQFIEGSFAFITRFFETSLSELKVRNPGLDTHFKQVDAKRFEAAVYVNGSLRSRCGIWLKEPHYGGLQEIAYSTNGLGTGNSYNAALSVEDDGFDMFLQPMSMAFYGHQDQDKQITQQGGAEYLWGCFSSLCSKTLNYQLVNVTCINLMMSFVNYII
jgi:hypothetical protein